MRTLLGALALVGLLGCLSACGGEDEARDPVRTADVERVQPKVLTVLHAPSSAGDVDPTPVDVSTSEELDSFVQRLGDGDLADEVRSYVEGRPSQDDLYAAIIAIGCDTPDAVVKGVPPDWQVVAAKVEDPLPECFVAHTSVAIVTLSGDS